MNPPLDERLQAAAVDGLPPARRRWAVAAITIAVVIAVLDGAIVNLALPLIGRDLGVDPATAVGVVTAYQIAITISLFPLAALGDRIGYERIYCGGLLLFTAASLLCAMAASFPMLLGARILQGLGASGIMSVNIALVRFVFPRHLLGRGIGYNTMIVALSATIGPSIASLILSVASWRWIFIVNLPLGAVALAIGLSALPRTPRKQIAFDIVGAVLSALCIGLLVVAIDGVRRQDAWLAIALAVAAFAILSVALLRHQSRKAAPLLPLDLLRIPAIGLSALTSLFSYIVQGVCFVALPFFFHDALGLPLAEVGLLMTAWPMAVAVASPIATRLSDRHSAGALGTCGLALLSIGPALLVFLPHAPSRLAILASMAICGFGFGLFQMPNSRAIIANAPPDRSGGASAMQSAARLLGQALGAASVAAIFGAFTHLSPAAPLSLGLAFAILACAASALRLR